MTLAVTRYMCGIFKKFDTVLVRYYEQDNTPVRRVGIVSGIFNKEYFYIKFYNDPNIWTIHISCIFGIEERPDDSEDIRTSISNW